MDDRAAFHTTLAAARDGDPRAQAKVHEFVYAELRRLAGQRFARERAGHTWQPTALVHEAWLRLRDPIATDGTDLVRLRVLAARVMREILVDHARGRAAQRRGGDRDRITFAEDLGGGAQQPPAVDLLALDEALSALATAAPRQARVVELRFFGGLSVEETAAELGVSARTVKDDGRVALARLRAALDTHD